MPDTLTLRELFQRFEEKRLRGKSTETAGHYYTAINHFAEFLHGREPTVDDLFDGRVMAYMHSLVDHRGIAIETAVSYVKKLLSLWRWGARPHDDEKPVVPRWPDVELLTCPEREPVAWLREEVLTLFRALCSQDGMIGPAPARLFWPALKLTFWDSAERLGAVLMLRLDDVNLNGKWAVCRAETRKGKLRDRGFPLHESTVEAIRRLLGHGPRRRLVFECPFGEQTLRDRYKAILRDAGLPHDSKRLFHCLRKTVASHWAAAGFDATELLDHSSREVTKRYLSPQIVKPPRPADSLWRPG